MLLYIHDVDTCCTIGTRWAFDSAEEGKKINLIELWQGKKKVAAEKSDNEVD